MNIDPFRNTALARAQKYIGKGKPLTILGSGQDGFVFTSSSANAVKFHRNEDKFWQEVNAFKRLKKREISVVDGCNVPQPLAFSAKFLAIKMSVVRAPYLLDFASATLDEPQDFTEEAEATWWQEVRDAFGADFPRAEAIYWELVNRCGLYDYDIKPRNLCFRAIA